MQALSAGFIGLLFGLGLVLSGMAQPARVLAFLDFAGDWDPSLMLVMAGAIAVYAPLYRMIVKGAPVYAQHFLLAIQSYVDTPLVLGSALFGIGWGLAGYCPGPGLVSAGAGNAAGALFAISMLGGMLLFEGWRWLNRPRSTPIGTDEPEGGPA